MKLTFNRALSIAEPQTPTCLHALGQDLVNVLHAEGHAAYKVLADLATDRLVSAWIAQNVPELWAELCAAAGVNSEPLPKSPCSILQTWVTRLNLRAQGTLLAAIRGCDTWSKESHGKDLVRELRGLVLVPHDARETTHPQAFMHVYPHPNSEQDFNNLLRNYDPLPVHYVMHLIHAIEVIGYTHPDSETAEVYSRRYHRACDKMHMLPETFMTWHARMNEDRIEKGTVAG